MPREWGGKWKGGRWYFDADQRRVFVIERRVAGQMRQLRLATHDEDLALGELARFELDPIRYAHAHDNPEARPTGEVWITEERIALYLRSIANTVDDHRAARESYLADWAKLGLDLRTVDRRRLRAALATFSGGHRGRTEALNAFARFLVREGDLDTWRPLVNEHESAETRAPREAYTLEILRETHARLQGPVRDVFHLRAATGMHHTEIEQLQGARVLKAPLPDRGVAIRDLGTAHEIRGVLQVLHKNGHRHRQAVDAPTYEAALRLREKVPDRVTVWEALRPLVPSNLRHTFNTLAGEVGQLVTYVSAGVDRSRIAQVMGHRAGSTMGPDRYEKLQVPPMIKLPLDF